MDKVNFGDEVVTPEEKTRRVGGVFSSVARRYDLMNDLMSGGMHRLWKNRFVAKVKPRPGEHILDMAGGTGDIAFRMVDRGADVTVGDINPDMLGVGEGKLLGILDLPAKAVDALLPGSFHPDCEHVGIDVADRNLGALGSHAESDVAGAARHVENVLARPRLHLGGEAVLPQAVHSTRHQVVHQVIAARNRSEDPSNPAGFLVRSDQFVAEIDLVHARALAGR